MRKIFISVTAAWVVFPSVAIAATGAHWALVALVFASLVANAIGVAYVVRAKAQLSVSTARLDEAETTWAEAQSIFAKAERRASRMAEMDYRTLARLLGEGRTIIDGGNNITVIVGSRAVKVTKTAFVIHDVNSGNGTVRIASTTSSYAYGSSEEPPPLSNKDMGQKPLF